MAKRSQLYLTLTRKQIENILDAFHINIDDYMNDSRVEELYDTLTALYHKEYPTTMPKVKQNVKGKFYKNYEEFFQAFKAYMQRSLAELAFEEFAATCDIPRAIKRIEDKAPQFFEQRLALVYEETKFNMKADKIWNGEQTVSWLEE